MQGGREKAEWKMTVGGSLSNSEKWVFYWDLVNRVGGGMGRENFGVCVGRTGRAKPERDPSGDGELSKTRVNIEKSRWNLKPWEGMRAPNKWGWINRRRWGKWALRPGLASQTQPAQSTRGPTFSTCISAYLNSFKCTILKFFITVNKGLHIFTQHQALKMMELACLEHLKAKCLVGEGDSTKKTRRVANAVRKAPECSI